MKFAGFFVLIFFACCTANVRAQDPSGQHPQATVTRTAIDSSKISRPDSSVVVADTLSPRPSVGDPIRNKVDSIMTATSSDALFAPAYLFKPTPRKAVIYSAIFPGLGQIYNKKYWKLPILYGGFVGLTYAITWNNGYYRDYLGAYQDIMDDDLTTNRWHDMLPYGLDWESVDQAWFKGVLQQRKDYYRYYRDLSIIGTVALYLVAIVDAYVDAQLFDFDISPDLSMRVEPAILSGERPTMKGNSAYGVQWSFCF